MIRTEKMIQLSAVVLEKYQAQVAKRLVELGQLDFISVKKMDPVMDRVLQTVKQPISLSQIKDLRRQLEGMMLSGNIDFPELPAVNEDYSALSNFDQITASVERIADGLAVIQANQRSNHAALLRLQEMQKQAEAVFKSKQKTKRGQENLFAGHLVVRTGILPPDSKAALLSELKEVTCSLIEASGEQKNEYYLLHLKNDLHYLDSVLDRNGWKRDQVQMGDEGIDAALLKRLDEKVKAAAEAEKRLKFELEDCLLVSRDEIQRLWKALRVAETYESIEQQFSKTERTFVFSGWILSKMKKKVSDAILQICGDDCYLEFAAAERVKDELGLEPPVQLQTPKLLKPFEKVITDFSIPAYGTLNPAFIVSLTFLVMFGMMFADVGHGAVIALGSLIGMGIAKKKKKPNPLFDLLFYCGLSAMVFGVLFGSYFGYSPVNGLWFNYHGAVMGEHTHGWVHDLMGVLALATWFGVAIISLGLFFNFFNCIAQRRWLDLFTDKNGLAGAVMYACGIYLAVRFMSGRGFEGIPVIPLALGFGYGIAAITVRLVIESVREHGGVKVSALLMVIIQLLIELLEVFSGYLANTLSFLRVAGLGIAHVSLMAAFGQLAEMVGFQTPGAAVGAVAVLCLGNILVIALEGLSAWIQTLRLHYYEFFSKYLVGGGMAYRPIRLSDKGD